MLGIGARGCNDRLQTRLLGGQRVKVRIGFAIGGVHGIQLRLGRKHSAHTRLNALAHGVAWIQLGLLRQVTNVEARHRRGFAFDFLVKAGHDLEQS